MHYYSLFPPVLRAKSLFAATTLAVALTSCSGGGGGGDSGMQSQNQHPQAIAACRTTPQNPKPGEELTGKLQASDPDNNSNELMFSLDPNVPGIAGPIFTSKGEVMLTNVTNGDFTYTPFNAQNGTRGVDTFTFRVDDPESFNTAVQTIIVNPAIMPLGDSITRGTTNDPNVGNPPVPSRVGYRKPLYDRLRATANGAFTDPVNGNPAFDFVGSDSAGSAVLDFDFNNEGHGGFTTIDLIDGDVTGVITDPGYTGIFNALEANPTDVILLHIGTNDFSGAGTPDTVRDTLEALLSEIDRWENTSLSGVPITLYLAKIIDFNPPGSFGDPNEISNFNAMLDDVKAICDIGGACPDTVILVDHQDAFRAENGQPDSELYGDESHPDEDNLTPGYTVMSDTWFGKLVEDNNTAASILAPCP